MPPQRSVSGLMAKMGGDLRAAHEAHKGDETDYGSFGSLPEGIDGGVAQLFEIKFEQYKEGQNKGMYYFSAAGTVVSPEEVKGVRVAGKQTRIREPLGNTPNNSRKTIADHIAWIYNQLRLLGVDTANMEVDDLEATCAALVEAAPFFSFRTWKGAKQTTGQYAGQEPRVQHTWEGRVDYTPDEDAGGVDEVPEPPPPARPKAAAKPAANGTSGPVRTAGATATVAPSAKAPPAKAAPAKAPVATSAPAKPTPKGPAKSPPAPVSDNTFDDMGDLSSLAARATADDEEAQNQLREFAITAGATDEEVDNAPSWDYVVEKMILKTPDAPEPSGGTDATEPADEGDDQIKVTYVYKFRPIDKKTRKPAKTAIEVEVEAVDPESRTADILSLVDRKTRWEGVSWDALEDDGEDGSGE